jgi:hypothetical protein
MTRVSLFDRIRIQKGRRTLKQMSIFTRLRQPKSKDDKYVLDHQPNMMEGLYDRYSKIPSRMKRQCK